MFNIFNRPREINTNGYYLANKKGVSEYNQSYNLYYMFIFNRYGIAGIIETEDAPYNLTNDEFQDIKNFKEVFPFNNFIKYQFNSPNIKMRFHEPDEYADLENGIINPKNFREWEGVVIENGLILSCYKSYFSYPLQKYDIHYYFRDLKFKFYKFQ